MPEPRRDPDVEREESAAPLQPDEATTADPDPAEAPSGDGSEVAAELRTTREREGLSIGTLASLLGLPERTLEDVEAGDSVPHEAVERVRTWLASSSSEGSA